MKAWEVLSVNMTKRIKSNLFYFAKNQYCLLPIEFENVSKRLENNLFYFAKNLNSLLTLKIEKFKPKRKAWEILFGNATKN